MNSSIKACDKQFHVSGLLSYLISHNWGENHQIIELVDTKQLWNYKEIDRNVYPKGNEQLNQYVVQYGR